MKDELKEAIKQEHRRAELQRLAEGQDGCGCPDCQELYKTLDLSQYGSRVIESGGAVVIEGKKEKPEFWAENDTTFVHYSQGWRVGKNGYRYCVGKYPLDKLTEPSVTPKDATENNVTSQSTTETSEVPQTAIMLQPMVVENLPPPKTRGRPAKVGEVSRMTLWRRQRQAVML